MRCAITNRRFPESLPSRQPKRDGALPAEEGRQAQDVTRFRERARGANLEMMAARKAAPQPPKTQKKIVGGC